MLCVGMGFGSHALAVPPVGGSDYQGNMTYGVPAGASSDNSAIYEILGRMEQLQSEVQQLRGMVEEQAQTISDLERKQTNMYSDLDERIQLLTSGSQPTQQASPGVTPAVAGAVQVPAQTGTQAPEAATAHAQAVTPAAPAQAPAAAAVQQPAESKATETAEPAAPKQSDQERYQQAYEALRNGHNAQAIKMFESLYADNPAGEFGDNTQYWLGEAYKINREFDKAKSAFSKVVSQYPNSTKVPDALLKLGYIELDQQNPAKARDYFTRITTSYPGTTAAHLAAKKLAQMPQ